MPSISACLVPTALLAQSFTDPAPPKLEVVPVVQPAVPVAQDGLKFHTAPKPLAAGAIASDWPGYMGPAHDAVSRETPLLAKFPVGGPSIVWEAPKGEGYASPCVTGDKVILFHRIKDEDIVDCLQSETGRRFWRITYPTEYSDRYGFSGGPKCQPVTDGTCVWTLGAQGKLHCIKLATGQVIWKRDLLTEFKVQQNFFGVGATPLLEGGLIIVNVGCPAGPCIAGFDKKTGKMAWGAGSGWTAGYASPIAGDIGGKRRIFAFCGGESRPSTGGLLCIDPVDGKVDFTFPWRSKRYESVNASSPRLIGGSVFISECYGMGGVLLDLPAGATPKERWISTSLGTHFMTAVEKDGYLYGIDGHGPQNAPVVCIDLKTGKEQWRNEPEWEDTVKGPDGEHKYRLSPGLATLMVVDGRCLMASEYGHLVWLDLNPKEYKELDRTRLFIARETWGMPALSRGLLYVCQNETAVDGSPSRIICYDLRGEKR